MRYAFIPSHRYSPDRIRQGDTGKNSVPLRQPDPGSRELAIGRLAWGRELRAPGLRPEP